jgi:DNA-binding winged helix-turn-helix (wHTH) protein/tetratricopeptide (TPR) repeat protein
MSDSEPQFYEFGEFRIEAAKRRLLRNGAPVALTPRVFDTLLHLVQSRGKVMEKDELMRAVWPDTVVEENNLNQNISTLRRVLGEKSGENRYIATLPGRGYSFIAEVGGPIAVPESAKPVILAVLPFENLSGETEHEYIADGLTEEVIAALGRIEPERLSVIGRTSVRVYKGTSKTLAEIGRELDATYLIESSIRGEQGRLRILSKLIRASDQVQMWSASYDNEPQSMLTFERELSVAIAEQVRLRLSPEKLNQLSRRQTRNPEAYDLYLRGRYFWHRLTLPTAKKAIEYFTRATELDPEYALAWSGLADSFSAGPITSDVAPLTTRHRAREAAARAVKAEPGLAEAQTSLGFVEFWFEWNWPAAVAAFRKAIELDPAYPMAYRMLGIVLSHMREREEAGEAMRRLRELEPTVAVNQALSAQVAYAGQDYESAKQFAKQAIVVDPEFWIGHFQLGQVYEHMGENELALESMNNAGRFSSGNSKALSLRAYIFAKLGRKEEAVEVLRALEGMSRERYVPPYAMALIHTGLGDGEKALELLGQALAVRDVHLAFLTVDPKWNVLRADPRFAELVTKCGFAMPAE